MKNQRIKSKPVIDFYDYGFEVVVFGEPHDFCLRNITAKVGPAEIFDQALNSNYTCIKVLDGYNKEEVRKTLSEVVWIGEDFLTCAVLNFWNKETLLKALERKNGRV